MVSKFVIFFSLCFILLSVVYDFLEQVCLKNRLAIQKSSHFYYII